MNLKIRSGTVGYNNKILVSDGKFSLGKNVEFNTPAMKSHKDSNEVLPLRLARAPTITYGVTERLWNLRQLTIMKKLLWHSFWQVVLQYLICFSESQ